jgi:hypothetical protein
MEDEATALQDEEWGYPLQIPRTPLHQMKTQTLAEGFQRAFEEEEEDRTREMNLTMTRSNNSFIPCLTD